MQLEELGGMLEEAGPGPVAPGLVAGRHREQRALALGFGQRLARGQDADQAVGRGPLGAPRVHQQLLVRRPGVEAGGELVEAAIVEMRGDLDDPGHGVTSSPRRCRARPLAPRNAALRDAIGLAWRRASSRASPANSRPAAAAPNTSPQPVGSARPPPARGPARCGAAGRRMRPALPRVRAGREAVEAGRRDVGRAAGAERHDEQRHAGADRIAPPGTADRAES